jgi:hypothetical protein
VSDIRSLVFRFRAIGICRSLIKTADCSSFAASQRDWNIGQANRDNASRLLASLALYPCTQRLGMGLNELLVLIAQARNEATYAGFKAYFPL